MKGEKNKHKLKFQILITIIILFIVLTILESILGVGGEISTFLEPLKDTKLFLLIYISLFIVSSFLPIPFLTFFGATIFPFLEVFIYSIIGHIISFTILFYVARWLGKDYLNDYVSKKPRLKKLKLDLEKKSFVNIILLRFFYLIPPEFVCILGGISNMGYWKYSLASLIGTIPVTIGSIMLIQSSTSNDPRYMTYSFIIMAGLIIIPLFFIPKLRKLIKINFKKKK